MTPQTSPAPAPADPAPPARLSPEQWLAGLAMLLYVGSPQSREGNDRMEAKLDELLKKIDPQNGERIVEMIDDAYSGRHTDARHAHR